LADKIDNLKLRRIISPDKNKLTTLIQLISKLGNQNGIIFCNFKDTIQQVSDYLADHGISHGTFHGDMEQQDRERSLIKFRNGTHQLLVATDLAARGIDVPELGYIIHFQLPNRESEFIHRNGRTARMNADGTAYILQHEQEKLPDFAKDANLEKLEPSKLPLRSEWSTVYISGGRTNKISKGDIAGLFLKQGNLNKDQLGVIELKTDCAFVGVKTDQISQLLEKVNQVKLKEKKVRISLI
jgi:superfamily II DNA/RNA helicase